MINVKENEVKPSYFIHLHIHNNEEINVLTIDQELINFNINRL